MKLGIYKHCKGKFYQLIGVAKHSETLEDIAVYCCLYLNKKSQLWVRPISMFKESVMVNGVKVKRFEYSDQKETKE